MVKEHVCHYRTCRRQDSEPAPSSSTIKMVQLPTSGSWEATTVVILVNPWRGTGARRVRHRLATKRPTDRPWTRVAHNSDAGLCKLARWVPQPNLHEGPSNNDVTFLGRRFSPKVRKEAIVGQKMGNCHMRVSCKFRPANFLFPLFLQKCDFLREVLWKCLKDYLIDVLLFLETFFKRGENMCFYRFNCIMEVKIWQNVMRGGEDWPKRTKCSGGRGSSHNYVIQKWSGMLNYLPSSK